MSETYFTKEFREKILAGLVQDKTFLRESISVLKPDHFDEVIHQLAVERIFNTYTKTGGLPSKVGLLNDLINDMARRERVKTDGDRQKLIVKPVEQFVEKIFIPLNGFIADVKDRFLEYCRTQEMKAAAAEVYNNLETGSMNFNDAAEFIKKIHQRTTKVDDVGFDFFTNLDDIKSDYVSDNTSRVTTGFRTLDRCMGGGPTKGTLTTYVAPLKGGKSMILSNTGYYNLLARKNVVHFTLEINKAKTARRMLSRITGYEMDCEDPTKDLHRNIDAALKKTREWYKTHNGTYIVKEFLQGATVDHLRSYLYGLESSKGIKPDVVLVDYGDLVRSASRRIADEERMQQSAAYIEMRWMAAEFNTAVFTASQSNRDSLDKELVRIKHIAEDISKARHSDHIITISQTEDEAKVSKARLFFAASREGKTGKIFEIRAHWANCKMHELIDKEQAEIIHKSEPVKEADKIVAAATTPEGEWSSK